MSDFTHMLRVVKIIQKVECWLPGAGAGPGEGCGEFLFSLTSWRGSWGWTVGMEAHTDAFYTRSWVAEMIKCMSCVFHGT